MADNRDPRKSYRRRNRKTVTSSSNRSARSKKSTVPKPTSSSTRSSTKGSSSRVTTGQGGSRARVKVKPQSTGLIGTRNTPATKTKVTGPPGLGKQPKFNPSNKVKIAGGIGTVLNPRSDIPAKILGAASAAKGIYDSITQKDKPKPKKKPMASMGKDYKKQEKELSRKANASNFDRSFAKARKSGKKAFTWRGKKYNTKLK